MKKILVTIRNTFFQWLSTGFFVLLFTSCMSYYPASYRVESVLAVTSKGDTIQMPLSQIQKQYSYNTYSNWQFYYENNWWRWNNWPYRYYSPYYYNWNRYLYTPRPTNPKPKSYYRPRGNPPKPRTRITTPRGYTPPPTNSNWNSTLRRTQTTPNVQTRTNVGRGSAGGRRNNQ